METIVDAIRLEFLRHGARTSRDLSAALKASQPTISRALAEMDEGIVRIGKGSATQYGLAAPIGDLGSNWPLYVISSGGEPQQVGRLHALAGRAWFLERASADTWDALTGGEFSSGVFPDLPWFLDDARPQGFLGRSFGRRFAPELGFALDPSRWSSAEVAQALLQYGSDLPGAFVLGTDSLKAALAAADQAGLREDQIEQKYPRLARAALDGEIAGSSAGGEQPKFTAKLQSGTGFRHVLVKFSGAMSDPENRRWADLLCAEHIAAGVLARGKIPATSSRVMDFEDRRFLEVQRFDRTGAGGRALIVSMRSLDAAFFGEIHTPWSAAAERLEQSGWIRTDDAQNLRTMWHFGELIGNTDMHYGNVSFALQPARPVTIAPVYDMLPMGYRPGPEGRLPDAITSKPSREAIADERARGLAAGFWSEVASSSMISEDFQSIARRHLKDLTSVDRGSARKLLTAEKIPEAIPSSDHRTYEDRNRRSR